MCVNKLWYGVGWGLMPNMEKEYEGRLGMGEKGALSAKVKSRNASNRILSGRGVMYEP